jgi:hypothetical protein
MPAGGRMTDPIGVQSAEENVSALPELVPSAGLVIVGGIGCREYRLFDRTMVDAGQCGGEARRKLSGDVPCLAVREQRGRGQDRCQGGCQRRRVGGRGSVQKPVPQLSVADLLGEHRDDRLDACGALIGQGLEVSQEGVDHLGHNVMTAQIAQALAEPYSRVLAGWLIIVIGRR